MAEAIGEKLKAAALAALDEASRGHEEFRLRLAAEKDVRLAGPDVQRQVADAQSTVPATARENADISIVGGESVFLDRLVSSTALGKGVDGFVQHSETAQALVKSGLDGTSRAAAGAIRLDRTPRLSECRHLSCRRGDSCQAAAK